MLKTIIELPGFLPAISAIGGAVVGLFGSIWINKQNNEHNLLVQKKQHQAHIDALIKERHLSLIEKANENLGQFRAVATNIKNLLEVDINAGMNSPSQALSDQLAKVVPAMETVNEISQTLTLIGGQNASDKQKQVIDAFDEFQKLAGRLATTTIADLDEKFENFVKVLMDQVGELGKLHRELRGNLSGNHNDLY